MHRVVAPLVALSVVVTLAGAARADESETNLELPPPPDPASPLAHRGFQLALQSGVSLPMGNVTNAGTDTLSNTFWSQVPLFIDVGTKLTDRVFVGGYVGAAIGGGGRSMACGTDYDCLGLTTHFGAQVQYHLLPAAKANPWFGLGAGFETASLMASVRSKTDSDGRALTKSNGTFTAYGPEFARLMAGVDLRLSKQFGIGPVLQASIAEYTSVTIEQGDVSTVGPIAHKGIHEWITLGARGVLFP